MRAQDDLLVLNGFANERYLFSVVVDLNSNVCDMLLSLLRHDIVALAQRLSCNLHAKITAH